MCCAALACCKSAGPTPRTTNTVSDLQYTGPRINCVQYTCPGGAAHINVYRSLMLHATHLLASGRSWVLSSEIAARIRPLGHGGQHSHRRHTVATRPAHRIKLGASTRSVQQLMIAHLEAVVILIANLSRKQNNRIRGAFRIHEGGGKRPVPTSSFLRVSGL